MSEEKKEQRVLNLTEEDAKKLDEYSEKSQREIEDIVSEMVNDGFYMAFEDVEESVVKLRYISPWQEGYGGLDEVGEDGEEPEKNIREYRRLREEFAPVAAGVEYSKAFVSGSGFDVKTDDPSNKHQSEMKEEIDNFNNDVFMDDLTVGLDAIVDTMLDTAFTDGVAAAEIVYEGWEKNDYTFDDWVEETGGDDGPKYKPKTMSDSDWKKLKGIEQIKIIPHSYHNIKPYRDKRSWKVMYYTVGENKKMDKDDAEKLLPWQVLWLAPNRREHRMKGVSLIKPAAKFAKLLEKILNDLGISFDKWADRKFFFILGDASHGRTWAPQHIRNFLHDVKKMTDENKTGVAVPPGFDVKEIGGEVYDGGEIIDNLTSMICSAMRYPKSFLSQEGGKTGDDKAWLAWLVTYGRIQRQIKRAIEHQLWKRHLNAKYGLKRRIPKQGVAKDDQELADIYIPRLEWSSEGKWHRETKLEMLTSMLNVANPISQMLKYLIERDMARTLGYSEKHLEPLKEMLEEEIKIDKMQIKIDKIKKEMELEIMEKTYEDEIHLEMEPNLKFLVKKEEQSQQGPPSKEEQLENRLEGGVSTQKKQTGKEDKRGQAKPMGEGRKPNKPKSEEEE